MSLFAKADLARYARLLKFYFLIETFSKINRNIPIKIKQDFETT
jgi:hypothetical protein